MNNALLLSETANCTSDFIFLNVGALPNILHYITYIRLPEAPVWQHCRLTHIGGSREQCMGFRGSVVFIASRNRTSIQLFVPDREPSIIIILPKIVPGKLE